MKLKLILAILIFTLAISSCHKCVTCVPHLYSNGVLDTAVDYNTQSVKVCDKRDIDAYQSVTDLTDAASSTDTVRFICQ
jgi:hypothetical protein